MSQRLKETGLWQIVGVLALVAVGALVSQPRWLLIVGPILLLMVCPLSMPATMLMNRRSGP